jgi:ribonuclease D
MRCCQRNGQDEKLHLILTGEHLNKDLQASDWNKHNLDVDQIEYSALDAIVSLQLYHLMKGMTNISARYSENTASVGLSIDVVPRFGDRTVMAHVAAEGHILSPNNHWVTPD